MLGMPGFVVLAAAEYGGELELLVQTGEAVTACPKCGVVATAHGRRDHLVRDIPAAGRPVLLVWRKRIWRCDQRCCPTRTWTETTPLIRRRAALTERARRWACRRVGRDGDTVDAVRVDLGVGWNTVMRAVRDYGRPLIDDPSRLDNVTGLGVDEHVWQRARRTRRTQFATGIVDLTRGSAAAAARRRTWSHRQGLCELDRRPRTGLARRHHGRRVGPVSRIRHRVAQRA